jgi:hypothetical protein
MAQRAGKLLPRSGVRFLRQFLTRQAFAFLANTKVGIVPYVINVQNFKDRPLLGAVLSQ